MTPELISAIAGVLLVATEYFRRQIAGSKRERREEAKAEIREWREAIFAPAILEYWHQPHSSGTVSLNTIGVRAEMLRDRSGIESVKLLDDDTMFDMAQAALGTTPGVGHSGENYYRRD